jgi:hypothetical protein
MRWRLLALRHLGVNLDALLHVLRAISAIATRVHVLHPADGNGERLGVTVRRTSQAVFVKYSRFVSPCARQLDTVTHVATEQARLAGQLWLLGGRHAVGAA